MKKDNGNKIIAWVLLVLLVIVSLILTYIKFFMVENTNIEEIPVNNSSSKAIHNALEDITTNFNQNPKIADYEEQNIVLKAVVNNYSIYISYVTDTSVTYEFNYDNLNLNIILGNDSDMEKFNIIYQILASAVQKRLNNNEDINNIVDSFLTSDTSYDGLSKEKVDAGVEYKMNITKKITVS